jgi:RNA polymerase sigma-70 factor, ECF subfamily
MTRSLGEEPDSTLVAATKNRESEAFEFLVKRHETRIFAVAFRITRNQEDARDIVQQSFYKAFLNLGTFQGKSSFSTWLTRIAINEAFMCLRKYRTLREVPFGDIDPEGETVFPNEAIDTGESPAEIYEQHEQQRTLSEAINHLNPELREALFLRLQDRTLEETAEILGLAIGTLKARLFRARQQLRTLLTDGRRAAPQLSMSVARHRSSKTQLTSSAPPVMIATKSERNVSALRENGNEFA